MWKHHQDTEQEEQQSQLFNHHQRLDWLDLRILCWYRHIIEVKAQAEYGNWNATTDK